MTPTEDLPRATVPRPSPRLTSAGDGALIDELRTAYVASCDRLRRVIDSAHLAASPVLGPDTPRPPHDPVLIDLVRATLARHERRLADLDAAVPAAAACEQPEAARSADAARTWGGPRPRASIAGQFLG